MSRANQRRYIGIVRDTDFLILWKCLIELTLLFYVVSINASRLTTLIVAGCENVTDTFLLTCFLPDVSVKTNSLFSTPVSSVQECRPACHAVSGWDVVSQCGSSPASYRVCPADMCSRELCNSAALNCAQKFSVDDIGRCTDMPTLPPVSADHTVSCSTAATGALRRAQSAVNCGRLDWSAAKYCNRMSADCRYWTNRSYRLEYLDISGCWRITDLSVRCVYCLCSYNIDTL